MADPRDPLAPLDGPALVVEAAERGWIDRAVAEACLELTDWGRIESYLVGGGHLAPERIESLRRELAEPPPDAARILAAARARGVLVREPGPEAGDGSGLRFGAEGLREILDRGWVRAGGLREVLGSMGWGVRICGACGACETYRSSAPVEGPCRRCGPGLDAPDGRLGRYRLEGVLGRGGMGTVYAAADPALGRRVALKVLRPGADAGEVARFRREATLAARLRHPGIAAIHEIGSEGGVHYIAMDLVEGGTLGDRMESGGPLPPSEAARWTEEIARAVGHAHERGVVHRDLKPGNVLVDGAGRPVVADFGLARAPDDPAGLTRTGTAVGTPAYMAPEQALGRRHELGPAADVWALGVVLYELLAGRRPFEGETPARVYQLVLSDEPRWSGMEPGLRSIVGRCLEKDPGRRYPDANALAEDLARWRRGEPVRARRLTPLVRAGRWLRRRPSGVLAALLALVALLAIALRFDGARGAAPAWRPALRDDFEADGLDGWDVATGSARIDRGELCLGERGGTTIVVSREPWFGDVRVRYRARILPDSPVVNDLSLVLSGTASGSHALGYHCGVGGNLNTRSHLTRRSEVVAENRAFRLERGRAYEILVQRRGGSLRVEVDGALLYEFEDLFPLPEIEGRLGFYTESHAHVEVVAIDRREGVVADGLAGTGDVRFHAGQFRAAAEAYRLAAGTSESAEDRERAILKRALALSAHAREHGRSAGTTQDDRDEAERLLSDLSRNGSTRGLEREVRAASAALAIDGGDVDGAAALLAGGFDEVAETSDRFGPLRVLLGSVRRLRDRGDAASADRLLDAFVGRISRRALVAAGADNFTSLGHEWIRLLARRGRHDEVLALAASLYEAMADSASGAFLPQLVEGACRRGDFETALAWCDRFDADLERVRDLHVPAPRVPLEADAFWLRRASFGPSDGLRFMVLLRAGRHEAARAHLELGIAGLAALPRDPALDEQIRSWRLDKALELALAEADEVALRDALARIEAQERVPASLLVGRRIHAHLVLGEAAEALDLVRAAHVGFDPLHAPAYLAARPEALLPAVREALSHDPGDPVLRYYAGYLSPDEFESLYEPWWPWLEPYHLAIGHEIRGDRRLAARAYRSALALMRWRDEPCRTVAQRGSRDE